MAARKPRPAGPLELKARQMLNEAARSLAKLETSSGDAVAAAAELMIESIENGGTLYFCGNGGSAADAQHLACEFAGRYVLERPAMAAVALSTNSSSLTAIGNDFGYDQVFSRQLEGLGNPGDVLLAFSTSGASESVRRAVRVAHDLGMRVIGFTGRRGAEFAAMCDVALVTPHTVTPRIQEGHITMGHIACELVERALFGGAPPAGGPLGAKRKAPARKPATRARRRRARSAR